MAGSFGKYIVKNLNIEVSKCGIMFVFNATDTALRKREKTTAYRCVLTIDQSLQNDVQEAQLADLKK